MTTELDYVKADAEVAAILSQIRPETPTPAKAEIINLARCYEALRKENAWQPIETAPQTSGSRLVFCPELQNQYVVFWNVPYQHETKDGHWHHFGGPGPLKETPTHWMPLPKAPDTHLGETR